MAFAADAYAKALAKRVDDRVRAAAVLLVAEHKRDLSIGNPPPHQTPSKPGEFPRFRTLNLRDAVTLARVSQAVYRVGYMTGAWYILALQKRKRKTVKDTAMRIKAKLERIIRGA